MKLSFFLLFFFSNIEHSHGRDQVEKFKKQLKSFAEASKETEKKIQQWRVGVTPICVTSTLMQISVKNKLAKVALLFAKNTEFLEAVSAFTNDRVILTPRIHRKLLQDKHDARHLIKKYEKIHGAVQRYVKYTLKKQECSHSGSEELSKVMIQVYKNFQVLVELMQ